MLDDNNNLAHEVVLPSDLTHRLDILIGSRGGRSFSKAHAHGQGNSLLTEVVSTWLNDYKEAKPWVRRKMIPMITQQLYAGGCRFLLAADKTAKGEKPHYVRTYDTRKIHAKIIRVLNNAIKGLEPTNTASKCAKKAMSKATAPVSTGLESRSGAPTVPVTEPAPEPLTSTSAAPSSEAAPDPTNPLISPSLSRNASMAPFLARNASMLSIMSTGNQSIDCLIGNMLGDGVFNDPPKSIDAHMQQPQSCVSHNFSVEQQAASLGMMPPPPLGQATLSRGMTYGETAATMGDWGHMRYSNSSSDFLTTPKHLKSCFMLFPSSSLPQHPSQGCSVQFDASSPTVISNSTRSEIYQHPTVSFHPPHGPGPSSSATRHVTPPMSSDSLSEMTDDAGQQRSHLQASWLVRLERLEQTVGSLLQDNQDLRSLLLMTAIANKTAAMATTAQQQNVAVKEGDADLDMDHASDESMAAV
jgi:hypothetical protein